MNFSEKLDQKREELAREFRCLNALRERPDENFEKHFDTVVELLQEHFTDLEQDLVAKYEGMPGAEPSLARLAAMENSLINDIDYLKTLDVRNDAWVNLFRSLEKRVIKMLDKEREEIVPGLSALERSAS